MPGKEERGFKNCPLLGETSHVKGSLTAVVGLARICLCLPICLGSRLRWLRQTKAAALSSFPQAVQILLHVSDSVMLCLEKLY